MIKSGATCRKNRVIYVPFPQKPYNANIDVAVRFRALLDAITKKHPELFPSEISNGYQMKDLYYSKKTLIIIRRIKISGISYTIRPSFVMPYLVGMVDDVEKPLFFRKFDVPFWALSYGFGRNPSYWYRIERAVGRNSLIGTTIKNLQDLPLHLVADEKHTWILGIKAYIATTVATKGCIFGACIARDAGEQSLTDAYSVYKDEAQCLNPHYNPETVNNDGWPATRKAWKYQQVATKLWDCYEAQNKASFSQRVRRLYEWAKNTSTPSLVGPLSATSPKSDIISFFLKKAYLPSHTF